MVRSAMRLCSSSQDLMHSGVLSVDSSACLLFEAILGFPEIVRIPPEILPLWKFTVSAFFTPRSLEDIGGQANNVYERKVRPTFNDINRKETQLS